MKKNFFFRESSYLHCYARSGKGEKVRDGITRCTFSNLCLGRKFSTGTPASCTGNANTSQTRVEYFRCNLNGFSGAHRERARAFLHLLYICGRREFLLFNIVGRGNICVSDPFIFVVIVAANNNRKIKKSLFRIIGPPELCSFYFNFVTIDKFEFKGFLCVILNLKKKINFSAKTKEPNFKLKLQLFL